MESAISKVEVSITTQSAPMPRGQLPQAQLPKITLNGAPFPQPKPPGPGSPTGYQVAVIDPVMDITKPEAIRSNQFHMIYGDQSQNWMQYYTNTYARMERQLLTSGNPDQQIVFVVSFGLDANMPPTPSSLGLLLGYGAGPQLQTWETTVDIGSESGYWVGFPANYILVGQSQYAFGEGYEIYENGHQKPVQTTLTATLTNFHG